MNLTPEQIARLSEEYLKGTITDDDRALLEEWLFTHPESSIPWNKHASAEELKKEMLANISAKIEPRRVIPRWVSYAAAAAVLIIASLIVLYSLSPSRQTSQQTKVAKNTNDLFPGGDKALLTLSDGTVIDLDSASVGTIAKEGNASIMKDGAGVIQYASANKPAIRLTYNTLSTPRGGKYQLKLPDGSRVWLNAASSITYPVAFIGKERSVTITGEAYFEVAPDPSKPFRVLAEDQELTVLGTHFNVNAYTDEAKLTTTLLEGKVNLKKVEGGSSVTLLPGQQVITKTHDANFSLNRTPNLDEVMAWKNGFFHFENADLKTVMRQLARWYDVDIAYEGDLPERRFEGEIPMDARASEVLAVLEKNNIHFRINGKKIIVTAK